jgi:hypothetical protein
MAADADRIRVLEAALARVDQESALGARVLAALSNEMDPRACEQARKYALEAISVARRTNDDAVLLAVLNATGTVLLEPDSIHERLLEAEEAMAIADRLGDRAAAFLARFQSWHALSFALRIEEADALLTDLLERAETLQLPFPRWQTEIIVVGQEIQYGHLDEAEVLAEATMVRGTRAGIVEALAVYGAHLNEIRWCQGRRGEIAQLFIDAATEHPGITSLRASTPALCADMGDFDEARRRFDAEVAIDFAYPRASDWLNAMEGAVEAAVMLDDRESAAILYERLLPYADRGVVGIATPTRPVARLLGSLATRLGRVDEAEEHLVFALEQCERLRATFWTARTLLDHADLCVARAAADDGERARAFATRAREIAENLGNAALVAHADAILSRA